MPPLHGAGRTPDVYQALVEQFLSDADSIGAGFLPYNAALDFAVEAREGMTVVMWLVKPGGLHESPLHRHENVQAGCVIDGRFSLMFDDGERVVDAGEYYTIPPNVLHGARMDAVARILELYVPRRQDYEDQYAFARRAVAFGR